MKNSKLSQLLLIIFISAFWFNLNSFAQTGAIIGSITDSLSGETIIGAHVKITSGTENIGAITDVNGKFSLKPLEPGSYDLSVSFIGFKQRIIRNVKVVGGKTEILWNTYLSMGNDLAIIDITEYRIDLIQKSDPSVIEIPKEVIQDNPLKRDISSMIASMVPGIVKMDANQPSYFRGSRSDATAWYVDGVKMRNSNIGVPASAINNIRVYTGGIPAQYGDVTGGIVIVETKNFRDFWKELKAGP